VQKSSKYLPIFFLVGASGIFQNASVKPSVAAPFPTMQEPQKPIEFPRPLSPSESPLKTIPSLPQSPTINELPNLKVTKFIYVGNTVVSTKRLNQLTASFLNKALTPIDLQEIQKTITDFYNTRGYTNSGAFIDSADNASFKLDNAVLTIRIVEGGLEDFTIEGSTRLQDHLKRQIGIDKRKPFNPKKLLNDLIVLQDDPLLAGISATIDPPNDPSLVNAVRLNVRAIPSNPYRVESFVDNNGSGSSGSFRQGIVFSAGNPLSQGDSIDLVYTRSDGMNALNFNYSIPVTKKLTAKISTFFGENLVTQAPFDGLDIRGTSYSVDLSLDNILYQRATEKAKIEIGISAGIRYSRVEESLLGIPFQISDGATADGITDVKLLHFDQHLSYRDRKQAVYANSSILGGVDLGSATASLYRNGGFIGWQGEMSYTRLLPFGLVANARVEMQFVDNPVPSIYQFSLGGQRSIRGAPENQALGYNGIAGTVQLNKPIIQSKDCRLTIFGFLDAGTTWNSVEPDSFSKDVVSVGGGIEATYKKLSANFTYGHTLNENFNGQSNSLQADGFTFIVRYRIY
jgi:hemolysin activation/secretion protein